MALSRLIRRPDDSGSRINSPGGDMQSRPKVLATDLDGTLLPLLGNDRNVADLPTLAAVLQAKRMMLAFATGRHFESVQKVMWQHNLPTPDWIICDVGTSIYRKSPSGDFQLSHAFREHLERVTSGFSTQRLSRELQHISCLRLQEDEHQTPFKLSYYVERELMAQGLAAVHSLLADQSIPYSVVASTDPLTGEGLLDLLPRNSSKAYALNWWSAAEGFEHQQVLFAGDSGNDSAAFAAGFRSIIVDNAAPEVLDEARRAHAAAGWSGRIFAASAPATSGVLQGVRHFLK